MPLSLSAITRLSRLTAPSYSLTVNSLIPNPSLRDRLTSLSVTLNNGVVSDQLSMSFDDRSTLFGNGIRIPRQGVSVDVSMGYEAYQASMGTFEVNQVSVSGSSGGRSLSVSATPALLLKEYTRTWTGTIGDIVGSIASEYQLSAAVSPAFRLKTIDVINQLDQSDAAFLTHLAARYNAVCKPMAGRLLFMQKGEGTSASGLPMLSVPVKPHDLLQWSKQLTERQDYNKVAAYYWDPLGAEVVTVYFPTGSPRADDQVHRLPHQYNNEAEAREAAEAKCDELNRGDATLSLTIIGNPDITAEGRITISDLRSDVDGDYIVQSATHSFSGGGYQTTLQAYVEP